MVYDSMTILFWHFSIISLLIKNYLRGPQVRQKQRCLSTRALLNLDSFIQYSV